MEWRAKTGRVVPGVELRLVDEAGRVLPWDGETAGEIEVRRPVGDGQPTTGTTRPRSSTRAGSAPAT